MRIHLCAVLGCLLFACGSSPQSTFAKPMVFDSDSLRRHKTAGDDEVDVPAGQSSSLMGVPIMVTISKEGIVTDARLDRTYGFRRFSEGRPGVAAARGWRFRPFLYRGKPVEARGSITLHYRGPEVWRDRDAPFPSIDYSALKIELVRSACFGDCPDYRVTIDGSGGVTFSTRADPIEGAGEAHREFGVHSGTLIPGQHRSRIDRATLDGLIERFRQARFFGLQKEYAALVTDQPTYQLTFRSGGHAWTVTDYVGGAAGMPRVVKMLEDAVDEVAGTDRWVRGTEATIVMLRNEGFDFASFRGAALAAAAISSHPHHGATDQFILGLIKAGVPLEQRLPGSDATLLADHLLTEATRTGRAGVFVELARKGWLRHISQQQLSALFAQSGGGCHPDIARELVAAGADLGARTAGAANDFDEAGSATALISASRFLGPCNDEARGAVVAALIDLGVDVNATDANGKTALFNIEDPDIQERLLAAGARADIRDNEGNSPAFWSWTDRIVIRLLEAGADPNGRYDDGKSLREQARARDMPSVLAWLNAHNVK